MSLNLTVKHKLILLLITAITLSLALAGGILSSFLHRFYLKETDEKIHEAHSLLKRNLRKKESSLIINAAELSQNESIISSVNLISEYQLIDGYRPIIFDEEKKQMVTHLSEQVVMADFDLIAIYDAAGELISFSMHKDYGFLLGIVSYHNGEPVIYLSGAADWEYWTQSSLPAMVKPQIGKEPGKSDTIRYTRAENGFALETTLPLLRSFPDGDVKTVGFVEITNFLGSNFVSEITQQTQISFQLVTPDADIGNLHVSDFIDHLREHTHLLSHSHAEEQEAEYFKQGDYFLHSHSLKLDDDSLVYFIFGREKTVLDAQVQGVKVVLLLVLVFSGLICIPLGILIAGKTITGPIERLLKGVNALKDGFYEKPIPVQTDGELGQLAQSFNEMGKAIHLREDGLKRAKEEWERTFDAITDIITIQNKEFRILLANQATCDFLNLPRDEIHGRLCYELFHNKDAPCFNCPTLKTLQNKRSFSSELLCYAGDQERNLLVSSSPILSDDGSCTGIVYTAKDITELKGLETRLRQAQKMEAIGTLAGGIAHDFNNILTPILGYSELLVDILPEESRERKDGEQILKASKRAKELVRQILTFSRQTEHEKTPIQIEHIIKEALKLLRSSIPANIEIRQNVAVDCCTVLADPTQIHQILMNLCTNAYQAMQQKGGTLTVSLEEVEISPEDYRENLALQSGKFLKLSVSDTGCGMDKSLQDKIFEPYFTTKKQGEGTGLGLSVVHGIVKSHHGHVTVYSEPGQGTEFHVYLPCIDESGSYQVEERKQVPLGQHEKILVVDDEEPVANLLAQMLKNLGYEVRVETNSLAALEKFKAEYNSIDLVVTDMAMPGLNGADLASEILKVKPGIPLILCTGFSETINEEKARTLGFSSFLLKPILKNQLATAVREALTKQSQVK